MGVAVDPADLAGRHLERGPFGRAAPPVRGGVGTVLVTEPNALLRRGVDGFWHVYDRPAPGCPGDCPLGHAAVAVLGRAVGRRGLPGPSGTVGRSAQSALPSEPG
nr:hypothetical protein KPHV_78270 [Kitasatospora purpeofusca]